MSKIYYWEATMGGGKSNHSVVCIYQYKKEGAKVLALKPSIDTRDTQISSRIGISADCLAIDERDNLFELASNGNYDVVVVDESQFLSEKNCDELGRICNELDIPVICYGLRLDFKGKLFDGFKFLLEQGCKVQEIKTGSKERKTHHLKFVNGNAVFDGESIEIGDIQYKSVSSKEFFKHKNKIKGEEEWLM